MVTSTRTQEKQDVNSVLKMATEFHGHFGPFLTLGVRMGLIGLRELRAKEGDSKLHVTTMLKYALPFSCMLDGIQVATKCTVGNKRLTWKESKRFGATFMLEKSGRQVEIKLNSAVVDEVIRKLDKKQPTDEEVNQLAIEIGSRPEKKLFSVNHK